MAWALVCCALANMALAVSPTLEMALFCRFLAGAASGGIVPISLAWIGDSVAYERRQEMLTRLMIATILGMICGQWLGGLLADVVGWRAVFAGISGLFLVMIWPLFRAAAAQAATQPVRGQGEGMQLASLMTPLLQVFRIVWARRVLFTVAVEGAFAFAAFSFVPSFIHHEFGLSLGQSGAVMALYGLGGLCFAAVARVAIARLGERGLVRWGGMALATSMWLLTLAPHWGWAALACWLGGLGFYMMHSTLQAHATQMAPHMRGSAVSLFVVFLFLGQSLGIFLGAQAVDHGDVRWVFGAGALALPGIALWFAAQLKK
jgi:predicted MFS family arabinose efflux permease